MRKQMYKNAAHVTSFNDSLPTERDTELYSCSLLLVIPVII